MKYKDQLVRCGACGKQFVYTVREQRRRAEQGLPLDVPVFCPDCRGADVRLAEASIPASAPNQVTVGAKAVVDTAERIGRGPSQPGGARRPAGVGSHRPRGERPDSHSRSGAQASAGRASSAGRPANARRTPSRGKPRGRGQARQPQTELRIRYTGSVKWFDEERGYGFIAQEDGGEVFVHCSALLVESPARLEKGQPVEYEVERTERGMQAVDVVPLAW